MRGRGATLGLALAALLPGAALLPDAASEARADAGGLVAAGLTEEEQRWAQRVLPATVTLAVTGPDERPGEASGDATGIVVRADGLVAAPWRVLSGVARDRRLWVRGEGGGWRPAVPLGATWWAEVGLARVVAPARPLATLDLVPGPPPEPRARVLVVGIPAGHRRLAAATVAASSLWFDPDAAGGAAERRAKGGDRPGPRASATGCRLGATAALPAALGAPAFDAEGRWLGIVVEVDAGRPPEERARVAAADLLRPALDAIAREGAFDPADLGVRFGPRPAAAGAAPAVPAELREARTRVTGGALVVEVLPGGPANGRLWEGDVVLAVGGAPLFAEVPASFARAFMGLAPGVPVAVTVWRGGAPREIAVPTARARAVYDDFAREHAARGPGP